MEITATAKPILNNPKMIKEANDFALKLIQNKDLLMKWFSSLKAALTHKKYEVAIMDNFIAHQSKNGVKDFDTTYGYVIQAQQKMAAYKIYYWSGTYKMTRVPFDTPKAKGEDAEPIAIVGSGSKKEATNVSLGNSLLIDYKYDKLKLTWQNDGVMNTSGGNLVFGLVNISGKATKVISGTITEGGTKYIYTGIEVDPKSAKGKKLAKRSAPAIQSVMPKLEFANQIISMVSQTLFMAVNIAMLYKTQKEIKELNERINKKGGEDKGDEAELNKAKSDETTSETTANQQVDNADKISDNVDNMSPENFATGAQDASPATETESLPSIEPPADMSDLRQAEGVAEARQNAIENEIESQGNEPNTSENQSGEEGGEGEGEEGSASESMGDGDNLLDIGGRNIFDETPPVEVI